jgi:hypothetical protein
MEPLICSICKEPVGIEASKTDEDGKPVHEDCYVRRLMAAPQDPPNPQHTG